MPNNSYFEEPKYLPTKWFTFLAGAVAAIVLAAVYGALYVADLKNRITAQERIGLSITDEIKFRSVNRDRMIERIADRMDSIDRRLSQIEGKLEARHP